MRSGIMTEYLTNYMNYIQQRIEKCSDADELADIMREHKDKIAFMQHERIVHFLVTMLFALILIVFFAVLIFKVNLAILALVTIVLVLLMFYIKHYYFLENTVQKMYRVYDSILEKEKNFKELSR
jgi:fatty acid desaturase